MKKRMMSILLLATMVTGLIAGCGSTKKEAKNDDDVVTVTWMTSRPVDGEIDQVMHEIADQYSKEKVFFLALVETIPQLFVNGFVHPVCGLFAASNVEIFALLGFAAIVQYVFPYFFDPGFLVSGTGHDLRLHA